MKKYELLYIIPGQFADAEIDGVMKDVAKLAEAEASVKISRNESLGKIRLAYIIKKVKNGTYVLVHFEAEPESIDALDRALRLKDDVLRHTIVHLPDGAEDRKFEFTSYVAPLSEEARGDRKDRKDRNDRPRSAPPKIAPPTPAKKEDSPSISVEDLDKKLDEILDQDVTKGI